MLEAAAVSGMNAYFERVAAANPRPALRASSLEPLEVRQQGAGEGLNRQKRLQLDDLTCTHAIALVLVTQQENILLLAGRRKALTPRCLWRLSVSRLYIDGF